MSYFDHDNNSFLAAENDDYDNTKSWDDYPFVKENFAENLYKLKSWKLPKKDVTVVLQNATDKNYTVSI